MDNLPDLNPVTHLDSLNLVKALQGIRWYLGDYYSRLYPSLPFVFIQRDCFNQMLGNTLNDRTALTNISKKIEIPPTSIEESYVINKIKTESEVKMEIAQKIFQTNRHVLFSYEAKRYHSASTSNGPGANAIAGTVATATSVATTTGSIRILITDRNR